MSRVEYSRFVSLQRDCDKGELRLNKVKQIVRKLFLSGGKQAVRCTVVFNQFRYGFVR